MVYIEVSNTKKLQYVGVKSAKTHGRKILKGEKVGRIRGAIAKAKNGSNCIGCEQRAKYTTTNNHLQAITILVAVCMSPNTNAAMVMVISTLEASVSVPLDKVGSRRWEIKRHCGNTPVYITEPLMCVLKEVVQPSGVKYEGFDDDNCPILLSIISDYGRAYCKMNGGSATGTEFLDAQLDCQSTSERQLHNATGLLDPINYFQKLGLHLSNPCGV